MPQLRWILALVSLLVGILGASAATSSTNLTSTPSAFVRPVATRKFVDYAHPLRDYFSRRVSGWSVLVEQEMLDKDPATAKKAIARLDAKLKEVRDVLPSHAVHRLQSVPIFLMFGEQSTHDGKSEGAQFFAQAAPRYFKNLDPRMGGSVVIYSAKHFNSMTEFGSLKLLLHELSHAWHLEQWSENRPDILMAYNSAKDKGLYRNVRKSDGTNLEETYATVNHLEYFAELSCIWFAGNDHFPFDRGDLKLYDPSGYELVRKLWSENGGNEEPLVKK